MRTRLEHLVWCKQRALEYCDAGDPHEAVTSMLSDISKHPETKGVALLHLGFGLLAAGKLNSIAEARRFIEGFN